MPPIKRRYEVTLTLKGFYEVDSPEEAHRLAMSELETLPLTSETITWQEDGFTKTITTEARKSTLPEARNVDQR
jgi:hypothetical protein